MSLLLTALLLLAPQAHAGYDEVTCEYGDRLKTGFADDNLAKSGYCKAPTANDNNCQNTVSSILAASTELNGRLASTCASVDSLKQDISKVAGLDPKESNLAQSRIYGGVLNNYRDLMNMLQAHYVKIGGTMIPPTGPLGDKAAPGVTLAAGAPAEKQAIRSAIESKNGTAVSNLKLPGNASSPADTAGDPTWFAGRAGVLYMQKILQQIKDGKAAMAQLDSMKTTVDGNLAKLNTPPPPERPPGTTGPAAGPAAGSGLDMKSLAGLAAAGAGLAGLMKQQQQASNTPTDATSPTPPSDPNAAKGPQGPSISKFGDLPKGAGVPSILPASTKPDTAAGPHVPGGSGFHDASDISKGSGNSLPGGGPTPASAKLTGGGGGPSGAKGGGDDGGASAKRDPASAGAEKTDDQQGINGGGLGGGGPPSMSSGMPSPGGAPPGGEPPPGGPEDSMKDLLHEMKETAEGNPAAGDGQAGAAELPMGDEDLFPRVRACYVRVMKAGRVLDGLAEKITPESQ